METYIKIIFIILFISNIAFSQNEFFSKFDKFIKDKFISDFVITENNDILLVSGENLIKYTPNEIIRYKLDSTSKGLINKYQIKDVNFTNIRPYWSNIINIKEEIFLINKKIDNGRIITLNIRNDSIYNSSIENTQNYYFVVKNFLNDINGNKYLYITFFLDELSSENIFDVVYKYNKGNWEEYINIQSDYLYSNIFLYNSQFYLLTMFILDSVNSYTELRKISKEENILISKIDSNQKYDYLNSILDSGKLYFSSLKDNIICYDFVNNTAEKYFINGANFDINKFAVNNNMIYTTYHNKFIITNLNNKNNFEIPINNKDCNLDCNLKIVLKSNIAYLLTCWPDFQESKINIFHYDLNHLKK